ncbi:MAG: relaxase/mobilization nuclease domain-containing protein [Oscillospiraceae bacterium]|nr:relaxase/mobilization nuclease domain-containing protein [Oscillospiraceae bacterium]
MATFTPIKNQKQTKGALLGTMLYAINKKKTTYEGQSLVSGFNCSAYTSYLEMMTTKQQYRKTDKQQFFQFVQSFPEDTSLTPQEVHRIGLEFAARQFPDYEVLVATHCDTDNLHNHLIVNSVSFKTGKKLHQNHDDLVRHRQVNDEICLAHGQPVLECYHKGQKKKRAMAGEYRAAERGESWKFTLIKAIEEALLYSTDRESFIQNMEYEGYQVQWSDARKYITYTCPNGLKCRDNKLHDETYLKENLEKLFAHRQATGFVPLTPEPPEGWLGQVEQVGHLAENLIYLGRNLERTGDVPPPPTPRTWTDSKQKQREARKKLAQGHKLQSEQEQEYSQTM